MNVELYLGDCLEYINNIKSKSIVVIADPPYGINLDTDYSRYPDGKKYDNIIGDNKPFDFSPWAKFQAKEQFWFGAENYINFPMPANNWLCWDKYPTDKSDGRLSGQFELIWSKRKHKRIILRVKAINTSWVTVRENVGHPSQKPIELIRKIIEKFSHEGDTIFDPYMGTGTAGVASMQLGRNFIGCEIDVNYFDIAKKRIDEAKKQMPMIFEQKDNNKKNKDIQSSLF